MGELCSQCDFKQYSSTIVILVSGKSESGKGTVAEELERLLKMYPEFNVIRCSLSTYIRDVAKKDFYWNGIDTPESRKFMAEVSRIGTEFYPYHMARRVWERDIERNLLRAYIDKESGKTVEITHNIAIVESFRELVNYNYFKLLQGEGKIADIRTIRVHRPDYTSTANAISNHISESDLDDFEFDYHILNKSSVEKLNVLTGLIASYIVNLLKREDRDYIIKGISGGIYPCKPNIFEQAYELVDEDSIV